MTPGSTTADGIRATGFSPAADGDRPDGAAEGDEVWRHYRRRRVWMTARDRKRATYVARTEHPTGAAVMRF